MNAPRPCSPRPRPSATRPTARCETRAARSTRRPRRPAAITWLAERRAERSDEGRAATVRRAKLEAELAAERRHAEAARAGRARRAAATRSELARRIELERETLPALGGRLRGAAARRLERLERAPSRWAPGADDGGEEIAAELRECSQQEFGLQGEMREVSEALTTAEVEASQLRGRRDESRAELERLGASPRATSSAAADEPLADEEREEIEVKLERLGRRREQIGPVNPLAEREYAEAREHVKELAEQRKDLETGARRAARR